jgi:hypothetical protein
MRPVSDIWFFPASTQSVLNGHGSIIIWRPLLGFCRLYETLMWPIADDDVSATQAPVVLGIGSRQLQERSWQRL